MKESIIVDAKDKRSTISADIYGHFAEHLGRCIYGGFWVGKDSPIANINGYRKDVIQAFKDIDIPNLRWPGGCFADEYHWKDGIGPKENRKRMINTNWGGVVEDNSFGTHEFLGLCEELGCKPYITGNVGSGTVQEMDEWIEYMTFDGESPMANLRKANGRDKPWKVDFFGVGNENWGCGGSMRAEFYTDQYRRYQTFVRQYGQNKIFKIACGPSGDDYYWTDTLMKNAHWMMDGLSLHYYSIAPGWDTRSTAADFDEKLWYELIRNAENIDNIIRRHDEIMTKYDPSKRIALVVDEWGTWHKVEDGTNPGFLYQQNCVRDAIVAGVSLNIFNNHSDRVRIANLAQAVNVLQSPVLTEGDKIVLTPTWHVLHMYKGHQNGTLLGTSAAYSTCGYKDEQNDIRIPGLNVSASVKQDEKSGKNRYLITVVNPDFSKDKELEISLANLGGKIEKAEGTLLTGEKPSSMNTFTEPENVTEKTVAVKITDSNTVSLKLPGHSIVSVTVIA